MKGEVKIMEDKADFNSFKVHDKPEGIVTKEKEKAKHPNEAISKIVQNKTNVKIMRGTSRSRR